MEERLKNFKVLVIEDDRLMQQLVVDVLAKLGFRQVYRAHNGNSALSFLDKNPIDFIICDWRMPNMDGIEFTKVIRGSAREYSLVPIVMLTGNAEIHHVVQARDAGVNEYLIKPFTVKDLCARLKEIIENPREFVIGTAYKGPSRRRKALQRADGTERRKRNPQPQPRGSNGRFATQRQYIGQSASGHHTNSGSGYVTSGKAWSAV